MNKELLSIQLGYTHYVLKKNTEGLTHEQSLQLPRPGGNCLNWVIGHILAARNDFLEALGEERVWTEEQAEPYKRGGKPMTDGSEAHEFESLLGDLDTTQERLMNGLQRFDPERLASPAPFSPVNNENETMGSLFAGLTFHESYHAGQTGVLRRVMGLEGVLG
jgi:uncharacterized damage-inducible protein DinB